MRCSALWRPAQAKMNQSLTFVVRSLMGKFVFRVRIAGSGNRVFSGGNVRVPPILGPAISIGHGHAHWRNGISDQNSASIIIGTEAQKHSI